MFEILSLPSELCLQILENLDIVHKIAVSRTCAALRDIAQPSIYGTTDILRHNKAVSLADALQLRPKVGELIHHLNHRPFCLDMPGKVYTFSTHPVFRQSSALLPNLKTLELGAFRIDAAFCAAVVTHWRQLHTLRLYRCSLADDVLEGALSASGLTTLVVANPEHFAYYYKHGFRWDNLIPAEQLHTLTLEDKDNFCMNHMVQTIFPQSQHHLPALTTLTIRETFFTLPVEQLLVNTPSLRHLSLRHLSPADDQLTLHPCTIPHLEYFEGPARCMPVYVRSRPVHTVKVHTDDFWCHTPDPDFLHALEESTCPVTLLVLNDPPNYYINAAVMMSHAPRSLEGLGIDNMRCTDVVDYLVALPPLPALRYVDVDHRYVFGVVPEETMLATLSRVSFPELREATMNRNKWVLGDDDVWREI